MRPLRRHSREDGVGERVRGLENEVQNFSIHKINLENNRERLDLNAARTREGEPARKPTSDLDDAMTAGRRRIRPADRA